MKKTCVFNFDMQSGQFVSLLLALLLICAFLVIPVHAESEDSKHVLFLNSYNPGLAFSDEELRGVREILDPLGDDLDLRIEYMDTKVVSDGEHLENLYELYEHKYDPDEFDLIIAADNSALEFITEYRDELFPGTPVIFCGINDFSDEMIEGMDGITGVVEDHDVRSTMNLILSQYPGTEHIYVIHDTTNTGLGIARHIKYFAPEYEDQVDFTYISEVSAQELVSTVSSLPPNSVILLEAFNRDADGAVYDLEEIGDMLSASTDLPMYTNTETYLGHGVIGGVITSGYQQGREAGKLALRILNGEPVSSIPIEKDGPNEYIFDQEILENYGMQESFIPAESTVINRPAPDLLPAWVLYLAAVVIVCLIIIVLILILNLILRRRIESDLRKNISERERAEDELKKKNDELNAAYEQMSANEEEIRQNYDELSKTEQRLRESERKFRAIFDQTFQLIGLLSVDGTILKVNNAAFRFIGLPDNEVIGKSAWDTLWFSPSPESHMQMKDAVRRAAKGEFVRFETSHLSPELGIRYFDFSIKPVRDDYGNVVMLIPEGRDITDRKMAEEALKQALKKLNLLNSVTFNDIQNNVFSLLGYIELQKDITDPGTIGEFTEKERQLTLKITGSLDFARNYQDLGIKEPLWHDVLQTFIFAASHLNMSDLTRTMEVKGLEVYADPMLEKVFVKLIDNTIKHGKNATSIRMHHSETKDGLSLFYEDDGAGISPDLKEEIFTRGYGEQKGMGLFLTREILGITGIGIRETGEFGKGACFEMFVPKGGYRFKSEEDQ